MKFLVLGTPRDARGFALAGIESHVVDDAAKLREAMRAASDPASGVGLVLLSAGLEALYRRERSRDEKLGDEAPPAVLLPGAAEP